MQNQTIYALSTVFGKSGVAVIRVSGSQAIDAIKNLTNIDTKNIKPRYAYFCSIKNKEQTLDKSLVL